MMRQLPQGWKVEKLENLANIKGGFTFKSQEFIDEGIQVIRISNIGLNELKLNDVVYYKESESLKKYLIQKYDILMSLTGDDKSIKICQNTSDAKLYLNQRVASISAKACHQSFLLYSLRKNSNLLLANAVGVAQKNISFTDLKDLLISIPPLPQQEKIVSVLDTASALVEKQKVLLEKYDLFLKSKFIEMFGDPVKNPMGWEHQAFDKIAHSRLGKMLDEKREVNKDKLPYLANYNVQWGKFNLDTLREMSFDTNEKIEFSLKKGDLLICEGGEIGRTAIWKEEIQNCYFSKALHRCRVNSSTTAEYILYFMWFMAKNGGLSKYTTSATISHLTGIKLKKILIPIPPIELQAQFAQIVEQTEILKQKEQQKLGKLQTLYDALMKRAFDGEIK